MIYHTCSSRWQNSIPKWDDKMNPQETFYCNKNNPRSHPTKQACKESKSPQKERKSNVQFTKSNDQVFKNPRSAVVKTNSVFYSVLVVMWRQCDVAFLSTFILLLFLRIYQNLSTNFLTLFLLNITTQGVRHHSPSTTSLSLLFVRWTRERLLARRSVHTLYG